MKKGFMRRLAAVILAAILLVGNTPQAFAVGTGTEHRFCLVAEAGGNLIIAPQYVTCDEALTIAEALLASGHRFTGLENGIVDSVDGTSGNFTRSDQNGSFALDTPVTNVSHYRFSENTDSQPSQALQSLMTEMADYLLEDTDVQAAAKTAYETACARFVAAGKNDELAAALTESLEGAVSAYKNTVDGTAFSVAFTAAQNGGCTLSAVNLYGKVWSDENQDGILILPADTYTFSLVCGADRVDGSMTVTENMTVSATLPESTPWLNQETMMFSDGYGDDFDAAAFGSGLWQDRTLRVPVVDSMAGTVYVYSEYNASLFTDETAPAVTAVYTNTNGAEVEQDLVFRSKLSGPEKLLQRGAAGNTVIYRLSKETEDGYVQSQDYTIEFYRIPTLTGITVTDQNGVAQAATMRFAPDVWTYTYKLLDTVTSVTIDPVPLDPGYTVSVNGTKADEGGVSIDLTTATEAVIQVVGNGEESAYTLKFERGAGNRISFVTESDETTVEVVNSDGLVLPFTTVRETSSGKVYYYYTLVPGETYSYVATKDDWYHISDSFTLTSGTNTSVPISVPTENWLTDLAFGTTQASSKKGSIPLEFDPAAHSYEIELSDMETRVYLWANTDKGAAITAAYEQISYLNYHGKETKTAITAGNKNGVRLNYLLLEDNPYGNTVTVRLEKEVDGVLCYQDYEVTFRRSFTIENLEVSSGGDSVLLNRAGEETGFDSATRNYTVTVPMVADSLTVLAKPYEESAMNVCYDEKTTGTGYRVSVNGTDGTNGPVEVALNGTTQQETVTVAVTNDRVEGESAYTITVLKAAPVTVDLDLKPEDALLCVHEQKSGNRNWVSENCLLLSEGFVYDYTLTKRGYVGQSGTLEVGKDKNGNWQLLCGETVLPVQNGETGVTAELSLELVKASENPSLRHDLSAEWADFRGTQYQNGQLVQGINALTNNGITTAPVPISADGSVLYWANKLGDGFDANAVGSPILVGDYLITYSGSTIFKIDTVSGAVVKTGKMHHESSFSITPPTYYDGMIFVALADGYVQAFDAETLESLWIYKDKKGGQPNSPITVRDGYLYTGFWIGEQFDANFVCLSVTDEDPTRTDEAKIATWYHTRIGGFYWAGAYVGQDYLLVGTDDGYSAYDHETSSLLMLDPKTGAVLDSWDNLNADIRCTVVYDTVTDAYYFTSKGGTFYSVQVQDGKLTNKWRVNLSNKVGGTPMSTSSPVIYNDRAYVGVSGAGQFSNYSGHNITVIDLTDQAVAYSVETKGYPQTSGLLTTAYEEETGFVYVYFFDNATPGMLRMLRDEDDQNEASIYTVTNGKNMAYELFTPTGAQAQYAICSPIVDRYGTMYFKNDSAHLMAMGSTIEKLEITQNPKKLSYQAGERFDPAGMAVTATYTNGMTRDVTGYVAWNTDPLSAGDTTITITFPHVMYQNQEKGQGMDIAVPATTPQVTLDVEIAGAVLWGDANGDGTVTKEDAQAVLKAELQIQEVANKTAADVSGDGRIDSNDAVLIRQYIKETITAFPVENNSEGS